MQFLLAVILLLAGAGQMYGLVVRLVTNSQLAVAAGQSFAIQLEAANGNLPYTYTLIGPLPAGVTLTSSGVVSGKLDQPGQYKIQFQIAAAFGVPQVVASTWTVTLVAQAPGTLCLLDGVSQKVYGYLGRAVQTNLRGFGLTGPFLWELVKGSSMAPGLTLSSTGVISGTPKQGGQFETDVNCIDSAGVRNKQRFVTVVDSPAPGFTAQSITPGRVGAAFSYTVPIFGGSPPVQVLLTKFALPPGLSLSSEGVIQGQPTQVGLYSFELTVSDGLYRSSTKTFSIAITNAPGLLTSKLPDGSALDPYRYSLEVAGFYLPYTVSLAGGALPPGITLSPDGNFSGVPTRAGDYAFSVKVTDQFLSALFSVTLSIAPASTSGRLRLLPVDPTIGNAAFPYVWTVPFEGGRGPYQFRYTSQSLAGSCVQKLGQLLQCDSLEEGIYPVTVEITDALGTSVSREYIIPILPASYASTLLGGVNTGFPLPYSGQVAKVALNPTMSALVPPGMNLGSNGALTGIATVPGYYRIPLVFEVTRTGELVPVTIAKVYDFQVAPVPGQEVPEIQDLPPLQVGSSYSQWLGWNRKRATWRLVGGSLPPGISLDSEGIVRGTPATEGIYTCLVEATFPDREPFRYGYTLTVRGDGAPAPYAIANAASYQAGVLAPRTLTTVFGERLGPTELALFALDDMGLVPTRVSDLTVWMEGKSVPVIYSSNGQASFIAPSWLKATGAVNLMVARNGLTSRAWVVPVQSVLPGVFTQNGSGSGLAAALNEDGSLNGAGNPAASGSVIVAFVTGFGADQLGIEDRAIPQGADRFLLNVEVTVGGKKAEILYAGLTPGLISGVGQVNLRIPSGVPSGMAELKFTVQGVDSPPTLVSVR